MSAQLSVNQGTFSSLGHKSGSVQAVGGSVLWSQARVSAGGREFALESQARVSGKETVLDHQQRRSNTKQKAGLISEAQ